MILVGFNTHGDSLKNPEGILCREGNAQFSPWDLFISPRLFLTNETLEILQEVGFLRDPQTVISVFSMGSLSDQVL